MNGINNSMSRPKGRKDSKPRAPRDCYKTKEMIGNKYNRLTVLEIVNKGKTPKVKVLCECGTVKIISPYDITKRKVYSCGCYHKEEMSKRQIKPNNQASKRKYFNTYKAGAKTRHIDFQLTEEQVYNISQNNCYYCNKEPQRVINSIGGFIYVNGIDRVDNTKGYLFENCVSCCKDCNKIKHYVTPNIIIKAYKFLYEK